MPTTNGTPESRILTHVEDECARLAGSIRFERVPLAKLQLPPELFDEHAPVAPMPQASRIAPIIAAETAGGTFLVLDGCKRSRVLAGAEPSNCWCGIVSGPVSDLQAGLLRIMLNSGRRLDMGEQVLFYHWLSEHGLSESAPRLLGISGEGLHDLHTVIACHHDVTGAVCRGLIHAKNAADLDLLDERDRSAFLAFFAGLKLSQQTEREFLEWLPYIASVRGARVGDVLALPECCAEKGSELLNGPQKIQKLRALFHSMRYPRFDADLKRWNELCRKINPDLSAIQIVPDRFFEKNRLEVRVTASDPGAAVRAFGLLRNITAAQWADLMRPPEVLPQ